MRLSQMGLFTLLGGAVKIGLAYSLSYIVVSQLGFAPIAAMYLALILSLSSTPIIAKILEQKDKIRRPEVPFIVTVLVLEDLVAVFALGIISTPGILGDNYALAVSFFKVVLTFIFAYIILSRIVQFLLSHISKANETLVLATVSIALTISYLSEALGMGFSVGAFLAGSAIATSTQARRIEEAIRPFNLLFASFFFSFFSACVLGWKLVKIKMMDETTKIAIFRGVKVRKVIYKNVKKDAETKKRRPIRRDKKWKR